MRYISVLLVNFVLFGIKVSIEACKIEKGEMASVSM